ALAQRSQDSQQDSIVIVRLQPALGLFELARRVRDAALAVHLDEIRIPFASEGIGEDVGGLAIAAELNEALRCRARDPGTRPGGVGKTAPVVAQARGILRERLELLTLRGQANVLGLGRVVDLAPDELLEQRGNFVPATRGL